jgi:hypothetical protein
MAEIKTKGTLLQAEISTVFTTVAQRLKITPGEGNRNEIETTDLDDDAETSVSGILREGEYDVEGHLDPENATHAYLWTLKGSGAANNWKLILPNSAASEYAFSAWLKSFKLGEIGIDGLQKFTAKLKATGLVTLTV